MVHPLFIHVVHAFTEYMHAKRVVHYLSVYGIFLIEIYINAQSASTRSITSKKLLQFNFKEDQRKKFSSIENT